MIRISTRQIECDTIEINYMHSDSGELILTQVILWKYCVLCGDDYPIGWELQKSRITYSEGKYHYSRASAPTLRRTWTQYDREVERKGTHVCYDSTLNGKLSHSITNGPFLGDIAVTILLIAIAVVRAAGSKKFSKLI